MIEIKKAEWWRHCNCCNSPNEVYELNFKDDNHGICVALCSDCMEELGDKIPRREVKGNE